MSPGQRYVVRFTYEDLSTVTNNVPVLTSFFTPSGQLMSTIDLTGDWTTWERSEPVEVLRPELEWEGADLPVEPSRGGSINRPVNQLRDPAIYEEDGRVYLLYSVAGERGIALARVELRQ